mgnify:CR=1 FL=1
MRHEHAQFSLRVTAEYGKKLRLLSTLKDTPVSQLIRDIVETEVDRMLSDPESRAALRESLTFLEQMLGEES